MREMRVTKIGVELDGEGAILISTFRNIRSIKIRENKYFFVIRLPLIGIWKIVKFQNEKMFT